MFLSNKNKSKIYRLFYLNESGKRTCISTGSKSKAEALNFLKNFNENIKSKKVIKRNYTLSDIQKPILEVIKTNFSKKNLEGYNLQFRKLINFLGNRFLENVIQSDVESYKKMRIEAGLKIPSVNNELRYFNAIFSKAKELNYIDKINFKIRYLKEPEQNKAFSDSEISLILESIQDKQLYNMVKLTLLCCLRISETVNIKISDVNFENKELKIYQHKTNQTKIIPVIESIETVLKSAIGIHDNIIELINPERYLFNKPNSNYKFSENYISHKFKRVLRQLNIQGNFHSLRHSGISLLIKKNVPIPIVMRISGHKSMSALQKYFNINMEAVKEALSKIS